VQTLRDNIYLIDEAMLMEINEIVVKYGIALKKKTSSKTQMTKD
jgi:hypothetical protein